MRGEDLQQNGVTDVAGLVLFWPFLTRLFQRSGLLRGSGDFQNPAAALRGASLLHHIALGGCSPKSGVMELENTLCGVPLRTAADAIPVSRDAAALCDEVLRQVCRAWPPMEHVSADGLRQSFVRRDGWLLDAPTTGTATLRVARGPYDMLLQQLPWSLATVALPWMDRPLHVDWRGA
ncbi:contractile injection system tape measure protein [uncultured Tateyamaria sp.]|uniref:contractile injection system tape measure protein n=1 Tax=Tateyamaria sp. 1078 TaxID=3417464 RepID=UPI00261C4827|nr:contractile injection system tape measure protein [uncultured Tateyamaria sp.]